MPVPLPVAAALWPTDAETGALDPEIQAAYADQLASHPETARCLEEVRVDGKRLALWRLASPRAAIGCPSPRQETALRCAERLREAKEDAQGGKRRRAAAILAAVPQCRCCRLRTTTP